MISILLLLILAWSFYIGYRRGIVLQAFYLVATIVSAYLASKSYQSLGQEVQLVNPLCQSPGRTGNFLFPLQSTFPIG